MKMEQRRLGVGLLLIVATLATAAYGQTSFRATLNGAQEVPPFSTSAFGSASLTLNAARNALTFTVKVVGIDLDGLQTAGTDDNLTGMHFHGAPPGVNGPIVFGMFSPSNDVDGELVIDPAAGTVAGEWDLNEGNGTTLAAELPNLLSGGIYINIHTVAAPGGEIRGQVVPAVDAISLEAVKWRSRDSEPFTCDARGVGHVYLQRDVSDVSALTHHLCICVGVDSGTLVYEWRSLDGSSQCAELLAP